MWFALTSVVLATGCTVTSVDDGSTSDGEAGTAEGGSTSAATTAATNSGGPGEDAGDDGPGSCDFEDDPMDRSVIPVQVTNQRSEAIYLASPESCSGSMFRVTADDGAAVWPPAGCGFTCEDVRDEGLLGCDAACALPPVVKIVPGGVYELGWPGRFHQTTELPAECCNAPECPTQCDVDRKAKDEAAVVELALTDAPECDPPCDCDPTPGSGGWCELQTFETPTDTTAVTTQVVLPTESIAIDVQ